MRELFIERPPIVLVPTLSEVVVHQEERRWPPLYFCIRKLPPPAVAVIIFLETELLASTRKRVAGPTDTGFAYRT